MPVIRPAHELHQFVLPPSTPPSSAEESHKENESWRSEKPAQLDGQTEDEEAKRLPPTSPPKTPPDGNRQVPTPFLSSSPPVPQPRHNRARSFGAVDDQADIGLFRVNIERAGTERPKTAGPTDKDSDHLDVAIPHYTMGSPQFTPQGTPFLHHSFNASSSLQLGSVWAERGSITPSGLNSDFNWIPPDQHPPMPTDAASRAYASPPVTPQMIITPEEAGQYTEDETSYFTTFASKPVDITPEIFDELSFPPQSEDPRIVRYDPNSGEIVAATAPRIVAQITSATFLDYQLLSDFFLTYRLFLSPVDLVEYLTCRLRWAISRDDDTGRVVRVRTFVAIRHWLLNYFPDDFVPSLPLREFFAQRMNELSRFVGKNGSPSDMKIIGEIKRCWRRTCALYWDPSHQRNNSATESIESNITPGGPPGERRDIQTSHRENNQQDLNFDESDIVPDFKGKGPENTSNSWPKRKRKPRTALSAMVDISNMDGALSLPDVSKPPPPLVPQVSNSSLALPGTSYSNAGASVFRGGSAGQLRVDSDLSMRVATSSIPSPWGSNFRFPPPLPGQQGAPGSAYPSSQALSRPPLKAHSAHSAHSHKRSGSFTDAMRDNRAPLPLQNSIARSTHLLMAFPYPGSMVRGNVAPPTAAFVEVLAPHTSSELSMPKGKQGSQTLHAHNNSTGKGMKKLFVNMKKALSGKVQPEPGVISPVGRHSSPLLSTVPDTIFARRMASKSGTREGKKPERVMTQRIDLLGAGAAEAFQKAMREDGKNFDDPMGALMEGTSEIFGNVYMPSVVSSPRSFSVISSIQPNSTNESQSQVQSVPQRQRSKSSPGSVAGSSDAYAENTLAEDQLGMPGILDTSMGSQMEASTPRHRSFSEHDETLQRTPRATDTPSFRDGAESKLENRHGSFVRDGAESKLGYHHPSSSMGSSFRDGAASKLGYHHPSSSIAESLARDRAPSNLSRHHPNSSLGDSFREGAMSKLGHHQPSSSIAESFLRDYDTRSMRSVGTFHRRFSDGGASDAVDYRSDLDSPEPFERPQQNRGLRRRPGGNLKNVANVTDLSEMLNSRRRAGSLDTLSLAESLSSLGFVTSQRVMSPTPLPGMDEEVDEGHNIIAPNLLSLGAVAGPSHSHNHNVSPSPEPVTESEMDYERSEVDYQRSELDSRQDNYYDQDHDDESDGPVDPAKLDKMSFEAGVAQLALLPDNSSDDGGVDVALLKLQGLYKPKSPEKPSPLKDFFERTFLHEEPKRIEPIPERAEDEVDAHLRIRRRYKQVLENQALATPPVMNSEQSSYMGGASVRDESAGSNSILEPGLTVDARSRRRGFSESSVAYRNRSPSFTSILSRADFAGVHEPIANEKSTGKELRDDVSELSSEISFEMLEGRTSGDRTGSVGNTTGGTGIFAELGIPSHPLRHPPSPPMNGSRGFHLPVEDDLDMLPPPPATPTQPAPPVSTTSTHATPKQKKAKKKEEKAAAAAEAARKSTGSGNKSSKSIPPPTDPLPNEQTAIHLPFILAYDSELLAKQFALIEKDALAEVDWKELVELKWKHAAYKVHDWVEFLSNSEVRGVEVVIARFNLVHKWAISEVILTSSITERAATISKLIHIAAHSRLLQNYATMYQLTAALLSAPISRLHKTWALLPQADVRTFHDLEALVQPSRNFHLLRREMEAVLSRGGEETGVVPFVGLFTHDLVYNAQRPDFLPNGAPPGTTGIRGEGVLVNFEKFRQKAGIVKRLLRLVEASQRYRFGRVEGVLERCLWIGGLSDEDIDGLGRNLV
ncbi:hypothetical protein BJ508DRAFT_116540 [Ascobolus immersus RN42]|uniref:Ras GEF n=1 Tax=Ascobolus immersus RN42 TaxID=1160509 RepID=A0A3N4IHF8_ASCIM|nr:hypothetical protein BJ508DRAFT_116540 [Ascobolus immersus RN42]